MGRYQKIEVATWNDDKFPQLSDSGKLLFFYFLTCPHSNSLGVFVLKMGYVIEDLKWTDEKTFGTLSEVLDKGFVSYDEKTSVLLIHNFLKYNPPSNPNQFKCIREIFYSLPKSYLLLELNDRLETIAKRFKEPFEILTQTVSNPKAVAVAVTRARTKLKRVLGDSDDSPLSLRRWFDEIMWPSVPKKRGKELTWEAVKKQKPDEDARTHIVEYFKSYPSIAATYPPGEFFAEMQDPVRVIKNKRYLDVLEPYRGGNGVNFPDRNLPELTPEEVAANEKWAEEFRRENYPERYEKHEK